MSVDYVQENLHSISYTATKRYVECPQIYYNSLIAIHIYEKNKKLNNHIFIPSDILVSEITLCSDWNWIPLHVRYEYCVSAECHNYTTGTYNDILLCRNVCFWSCDLFIRKSKNDLHVACNFPIFVTLYRKFAVYEKFFNATYYWCCYPFL